MTADMRMLLVVVFMCCSGDGAGGVELLPTERAGERWVVSLLAGSGEPGVSAQLPRSPRSLEPRDAMQCGNQRRYTSAPAGVLTQHAARSMKENVAPPP